MCVWLPHPISLCAIHHFHFYNYVPTGDDESRSHQIWFSCLIEMKVLSLLITILDAKDWSMDKSKQIKNTEKIKKKNKSQNVNNQIDFEL